MLCEHLRASVKVLPLDLSRRACCPGPPQVCVLPSVASSGNLRPGALRSHFLVSSSPVKTKSKYLHPKAFRLWDRAGGREPWRTGAQGTAALLRGLPRGLGLLIHTTPGNQRPLPRSSSQCAPNPEGGRRERANALSRKTAESLASPQEPVKEVWFSSI